ncbi:MAG TPA: penicillin acylase family protein [Thermoleophilaceae bacterium]|jgi:acyl-homoserine lactone acylase PvdQ
MDRARRGLGAVALACAAVAIAAPSSGAQSPPALQVPAFGGFRSVLAQGEGQSITAADLAAYQASGKPPQSFVNQQPLYDKIMPHAGTLVPSDLDVFYKNSSFGSMPGGVASVTTPRPGVRIFRDATFGMAHIYGDTRTDVMFGAGYASAEERLFLMDALRRTAKGTLAGLTGASAAGGDSDQLTDQDFSDQELTAQFDALPSRHGAAGQRAHSDIASYVDGINQRIDEVNADPAQLPAEYAALGTKPERWTVSDSVAEATLLVTQFTVSNGSEEVNAELQQAFQKRFGNGWRKPYHDLREAQDPEAFTVAKRRFPSDNPGRVRPGRNAMPDPGSMKKRNTLVEGPGAEAAARARAKVPDWVRSVNGLKASLPDVESNAVMVPGRRSADGHGLAAMGPQVSYYSPQIFSEYELHGGGIDATGVAFPGAAPYVLIGHGVDFAWSGTSANGDNQDTFVERLCNPDGSAPSTKSTHYTYKGQCRAFTMRDQSVTTPFSPISPTDPPQKITYRTMRSVHGPVFAFATVGGAPVALAKAKGVDFHELDAAIPFMRLAENEPKNAREFMSIMGAFPGTENWFYVDRNDVAFQQSGVFPKHARGSDVDRPFVGDGSADWQGFDPDTYTFKAIPASHRPRAINPKRDGGLIVSWNNKEAPGWRKGPREWSNGPVHRALILQTKVRQQARSTGGKVSLTQLARAVNLAATTDLRGEDDYPLMRKVIGRATGEDEQILKALDAWSRAGANRLDGNDDNVYDHSMAIATMDAWWTRFVRSAFQPSLGKELFDRVESRVLALGNVDDDWGWDWTSHVSKDLRSVLGRKERGRYSRIYCGGPVSHTARGRRRARRHCRDTLLITLRGAVAEVKQRLGPDPSQWKVPATCEQTKPVSCDQIVPTTAGAVDTPPFPWQNRGTYHQVVEVDGHR